MSWHDTVSSIPFKDCVFLSVAEVYWFLLNHTTLTVLVDLLLLSHKATHPKRVAVVEDHTLITWIKSSIILQDVGAFFILSQLEQIFSQ